MTIITCHIQWSCIVLVRREGTKASEIHICKKREQFESEYEEEKYRGRCWEGVEMATSPDQFACIPACSWVCGILLRTEVINLHATIHMPQSTCTCTCILVINNIQHLKCQLRWRGSLHVHGKYTIKPSTEMYRDVQNCRHVKLHAVCMISCLRYTCMAADGHTV